MMNKNRHYDEQKNFEINYFKQDLYKYKKK